MNIFDLAMKIDDGFLGLASFVKNISKRCKLSYLSARINLKQDKIVAEKDLFIVLNGPSVKKQNLLVMKDKDVMFVNRGFLHPTYKEFQPKYHVFVDTKMIKGLWPVSWLNEIWKLSPNTKVIMPLAWRSSPYLADYKENKNIIWLTHEFPYLSIGVSAACFAFAYQCGYKKIYFTGFEATGIGYEMIKAAESHFYGNDEEWKDMNSAQFSSALYQHSRHLRELNKLAIFLRKKGVEVVNLTQGGLLDMFKRENYPGLN